VLKANAVGVKVGAAETKYRAMAIGARAMETAMRRKKMWTGTG